MNGPNLFTAEEGERGDTLLSGQPPFLRGLFFPRCDNTLASSSSILRALFPPRGIGRNPLKRYRRQR